MKHTKLFALMFSLLLMLSVIPVHASTIVDSGECGYNVNWTLDSDGLLTISGSDEVEYYYLEDGYTMAPWGGSAAKANRVKTVVIQDGVTSIGGMSFYGCTKLTSVTIPSSLTSIGYSAFYGCTDLISVTVAEGNPVYHSMGNCMIETESKTLIFGCKTSVIPSDGSVTSIGYSAFYGCTGLKSVTIPNSVTSIGNGAFSGCTGMTSMAIPNSVTSIEDHAFYGCTDLTSVTVAEGNPVYHSVGNCMIETESKTLVVGCKTSEIPSDGGVTSIGDGAYKDCTGLTSVMIPNSVTSIGSCAFYGCTGLTSVTIPNSVTYIGDHVFYGCTGLTSIMIPNSVTEIGWDAIPETTVIYGMAGSYAQAWAKENGRAFVVIDRAASDVLPGDVSGDGETTAEDARLALRGAVGLEKYEPGSPEFLAADADHNNVLEAADARLILRAAVGLEAIS